MSWSNDHMQWLENTGQTLETSCGKKVPIFRFTYDMENEEAMSTWAAHFRNHYCTIEALETLKPRGMSNEQYLVELKFPDGKTSPGPSIRAGDFSEILVADYLEFLRSFYVPRTRYDRKIIGNESSKGSDVIAFKKIEKNPSRRDELLIYEVKAKLSNSTPTNVLQSAIDDSSKDKLRIAESLNAIKQRLFDKKDSDGVEIVGRFQDSVDHPYKQSYGAAAVITEKSYSEEKITESDTEKHVSKEDLELLLIVGEDLMSLAHKLYERAANEA